MTAARIDWPKITRALVELRRGAKAITRAVTTKKTGWTSSAREQRTLESHQKAMSSLSGLVAEKASQAAKAPDADAALDAALQAVELERTVMEMTEALGGP